MVKRTLRLPPRHLTLPAAAAAVVAAAAVAAVLLLGAGSGAPAIAPPATIAVHADLGPAAPAFGDRIDARIVIGLNRRTVRPRTLRYSYGLAPLTSLHQARTSRSASGNLELVTLVTPVTCVTAPCVAGKGITTLDLPRVTASVMRTTGARQSVSARWPALTIGRRVPDSALASASPRFEADASPPAPTFGVAPSTLATALDVVAALCAVAAVALAAWQALLFARRRPEPGIGELEQALRMAREARGLPVPHRRRALGLVARLLGRERLSTAASELAWSEHQPEPDELEALVSEIEREASG